MCLASKKKKSWSGVMVSPYFRSTAVHAMELKIPQGWRTFPTLVEKSRSLKRKSTETRFVRAPPNTFVPYKHHPVANG